MLKSLRGRLTLIMIVLAVVPTLLAGGTATLRSFTAQREQSQDLQAEVARRVAGRPPWEGSFPGAWAHLLDTYVPHRLGGTGRTWRWDLLASAPAAASALRLIVAGGLTPENVRDAVRVARPWGVDVSTGVEAAAGRKDPVKVARFIAHVKEEEIAT